LEVRGERSEVGEREKRMGRGFSRIWRIGAD
jgi:hypothetical protein